LHLSFDWANNFGAFNSYHLHCWFPCHRRNIPRMRAANSPACIVAAEFSFLCCPRHPTPLLLIFYSISRNCARHTPRRFVFGMCCNSSTHCAGCAFRTRTRTGLVLSTWLQLGVIGLKLRLLQYFLAFIPPKIPPICARLW
jgi:hypothetical protein